MLQRFLGICYKLCFPRIFSIMINCFLKCYKHFFLLQTLLIFVRRAGDFCWKRIWEKIVFIKLFYCFKHITFWCNCIWLLLKSLFIFVVNLLNGQLLSPNHFVTLLFILKIATICCNSIYFLYPEKYIFSKLLAIFIAKQSAKKCYQTTIL
jgi:hypothetical protein